ncbi:phosphatase PAP2 family protein [Flaviaesturariibacter aridisoli]|uniref:Phosphatase PAP2 family protein n=1 Tax=Flaviaesturariibacter aridisoli TaxID=2545761 RepID=A0A4R4DV35_9BACT|nr:phosphatase PAP2 family protein [Flaviaesturariibacter aridisoli]TCZ67186.1 phosphatase PAP2 family protein [Flaviaesturariibacter aridisoli]
MDVAQNIYKQYRIAVAVAFAMALAAAGLLTAYGKDQSFVLVNGWNTAVLDRLMPWVTHLGNGFIYVPILLLTWLYRRDYIVAIIAGIAICFLFTYTLKNYVYPEELRPFSLAARNIAFHKVAGVDLHENYSFPSGHTSTAFTMALLLAALQRHRALVIALPFVALLVGFSRIYLAQHFLTDVTAGIMVGIVSSYLSLLTYRVVHRRRLEQKKSQV